MGVVGIFSHRCVDEMGVGRQGRGFKYGGRSYFLQNDKNEVGKRRSG